MKLYLNVCCWNRPFDDQSQNRVRLEAAAVLSILELAQADEVEIISSDIIGDELSEMPDSERRGKVELLLALATARTSLTPALAERGVELKKQSICSFDALHLAAAESARSDYFLTTDEDLVRKAKRAVLKVKVENPAKWLIQETTD